MKYNSVAEMVERQINLLGLRSVGYATQGQSPSLEEINDALPNGRGQWTYSRHAVHFKLVHTNADQSYYLVKRFYL